MAVAGTSHREIGSRPANPARIGPGISAAGPCAATRARSQT